MAANTSEGCPVACPWCGWRFTRKLHENAHNKLEKTPKHRERGARGTCHGTGMTPVELDDRPLLRDVAKRLDVTRP